MKKFLKIIAAILLAALALGLFIVVCLLFVWTKGLLFLFLFFCFLVYVFLFFCFLVYGIYKHES